jgi:arabinose-5-phosphate isomerase
MQLAYTGLSSVPLSSALKHQQVAKRVIDIESNGLRALSDGLDENFDKAIEWLSAIRGHLIVTGMGKSGHIAGKMAATLASTGTPSFFVHPAEAAHGDLGMITRQDAVIALSESGNSDELAGIIHYTRRHFIPLLAITRDAKSTLGQAADLCLLLPKAEPACPLRLAPTTSTAMMMALGDALAIALLEKRRFSSEDFREFHPGGQLGRKLKKVSDLMHVGDIMPLVSPRDKMRDVIVEMTAKRFGCAGVVDEAGHLVGIVTDGDIRRHMRDDFLMLEAGLVMTRNPRTITPASLAIKALGTMHDNAITCLFCVSEQGTPEGIIHIHDCLAAGLDPQDLMG